MRLARPVLVGAAVVAVIILVAALNVWVFWLAKPAPASLPESAKTVGSGRLPIASTPTTSASVPTPTPTLRPTGPGEFACDPYGVCNKYSKEARAQFCRVTYADDRCLDQCGEKEKQCTN